jgi:hypothetical protein
MNRSPLLRCNESRAISFAAIPNLKVRPRPDAEDRYFRVVAGHARPAAWSRFALLNGSSSGTKVETFTRKVLRGLFSSAGGA